MMVHLNFSIYKNKVKPQMSNALMSPIHKFMPMQYSNRKNEYYKFSAADIRVLIVWC